jgi:hypothetical protein
METSTTKTATFRSKVFKMAYSLMKSTGKGFAVCLAKAWNVYRLAKKMLAGAVKFSYEKADGSVRNALGSINTITATERDEKGLFTYFDIEAQGFRCFKIENLIAVH